MLVNKSSILIFNTVTCLSKPFKMASTTLSIYIIGISGANNFMYGVTADDLYIKLHSCGANRKIKIEVATENSNVYVIIFFVILDILEDSCLVLNSVNSGISKFANAKTIVLGNNIKGIAIPEIRP